MFDGVASTVQPLFVTSEELPRWLPRVRPHLAKMAAASGGRYEPSDILGALACGNMQLWLALDGAQIAAVMLTEVVRYPRLSALRCIGISGHRPRRWMHLLANVEETARRCFGCTRIEAFHQPGHERLLRTGGWRVWHLMSEKEL